MILPWQTRSLLHRVVLSFSIGATVLFAVTGWIAVDSAGKATAESLRHEVRASFQAYQSLWKARADRLSSVSSILAAMSDVRAAFSTGDEATIRDTAGELWSRVSDEDAIFLVASPRGRVIASLGGASGRALPAELPVVREAAAAFPAQASGFLVRGDLLYHITVTPVYVQAGQGNALIDVLVAGFPVTTSVARSFKAATGGSEFLFLAHGRVVASSFSESDAAAVAAKLAAGQSTIRAGGSGYAPLVSELTDVEGHRMGQLAILRSFDGAEQEIAKLRRNIAEAWLLALLTGLALTYLAARRIVEPIKKLDRAAAQVAAQNYDCEVPVTSQDELGRLAATFNGMCASIRQAREDLIRSERIGAVGRLAASIVHDLRNPLAAVYGGAEVLMDSRLSEAQTQRLVRNMYQASSRIRQMLQDLLDLGRGRSGEMRPANLREVVTHVVDSLALDAENQGVRITFDLPENLELKLDRNRIERVLANLIGNAAEAMGGRGAITISAVKEVHRVRVEVRDTGPGLAPEVRDRLFQPFVTGRKGNGLGLGLALSRQAVLEHGGEMWAESKPGGGACFCFSLPLDQSETRAETVLPAFSNLKNAG